MTDSGSGQEAEQQRAYEAAQAGQEPYAPYSPRQPGAPAAGYPQDPYNPVTNSVSPPPNLGYGAAPGYNPADYPPPAGPQPAAQIHPDYGFQPQQPYPPPAGGPYTPAQADPYAAPGGGVRRGDENVSAQPVFNDMSGALTVSEHHVEEGG